MKLLSEKEKGNINSDSLSLHFDSSFFILRFGFDYELLHWCLPLQTVSIFKGEISAHVNVSLDLCLWLYS